MFGCNQTVIAQLLMTLISQWNIIGNIACDVKSTSVRPDTQTTFVLRWFLIDLFPRSLYTEIIIFYKHS